MASNPIISSLFLVMMLLCYYSSPNNYITTNSERNELRPYNDISGVDLFDVRHPAEDVCRIGEIKGSIYDPHKYRFNNTTSNNLGSKPVISYLIAKN